MREEDLAGTNFSGDPAPEPVEESWAVRLRLFGTYGGIFFGLPIPFVLGFASGITTESRLELLTVFVIGSVPLVASILTLVNKPEYRKLFSPVYAIGGALYLILALVALVTVLVPLVLIPVAIGLFLHVGHTPDGPVNRRLPR